MPCFIDGPSITYGFEKDNGELLKTVGFAAIVGNPSIAERLYRLGYHSARGYTYWQPKDNKVTKYLFRGMANSQTTNFEEILSSIQEETFPHKSYIQIVREGLDGLAHRKRELRTPEIKGAVAGIWQDIVRLLDVLQSKFGSIALYITADHGILWKDEHDWELITQQDSKPRYCTSHPENQLLSYTIRMERSGVPYYLFGYPYLGAPIRKNDSGTHGGLSYQESFVPFIMIEV